MKTFAHIIWLIVGGFIFFITGKTPSYGYQSMRILYCITNGYSNDILSGLIAFIKGRYSFEKIDGILGKLSLKDVESITENIRKNGFYVFPESLDIKLCESLIEFALKTPVDTIPPVDSLSTSHFYDPDNPQTVKYQLREEFLVSMPIVQKLITDISILAIAQEYLSCKPLLDLVEMWWSTAFCKTANSAAAQLYHFDMDRIKFIKFFIYLTDVTPQRGPHCYVRGSHQRKPRALLKDSRLSDQDIEQYYTLKNCVEIIGAQGTIIAADTRGFHKGKLLDSGDRLIFQIEFTNSLFGASYNQFNLLEKYNQKLADASQMFPHTYTRFNLVQENV